MNDLLRNCLGFGEGIVSDGRLPIWVGGERYRLLGIATEQDGRERSMPAHILQGSSQYVTFDKLGKEVD
jgi:hypothetical protein